MAVMDKTLTCSDCGTEFIFTARDQEFYAERGFSTPRRCRQCREQAKVARGDRTGGGGGGGAPRQMYDVVCAQCGTPLFDSESKLHSGTIWRPATILTRPIAGILTRNRAKAQVKNEVL